MQDCGQNFMEKVIDNIDIRLGYAYMRIRSTTVLVYIKIDDRFMELRPLLMSINKKLTEQYFIDCSFEGSK